MKMAELIWAAIGRNDIIGFGNPVNINILNRILIYATSSRIKVCYDLLALTSISFNQCMRYLSDDVCRPGNSRVSIKDGVVTVNKAES